MTNPVTIDNHSLEPLPPGSRWLAAILRALPGGSVASMTTEQITRHQQRPVGDNAVTRLLLGSRLPGVTMRDWIVGSKGVDIPVRIYTPGRAATPSATVVYFHGGGWALGDAAMGGWLCSRVARALSASVVAVGYRLAPTDPFPAALDDCVEVLEQIASGAIEGVRRDALLVMGDSAGGNLAAAASLRARDELDLKIVHQTLMYPAVDLRSNLTGDARRYPVLSTKNMAAYIRWYLGADGDPSDPRVSPILATNHAGLPPTLVILAGHDPLRAEGQRYAKALSDAKVDVHLAQFPSMPHGFIGFPKFCAAADEARELIVDQQRLALASIGGA